MKMNEVIGTSKIVDLRPGQAATIDHGDGTKTTVDLKKNPQALTKNPRGTIKLNKAPKPGVAADPATLIKKGDIVDTTDEDK